MYSGCQKAPIRFFPCGVSMAVFPPMLESTIAKSVVGIWAKQMCGMLRMSLWWKDRFKVALRGSITKPSEITDIDVL